MKLFPKICALIATCLTLVTVAGVSARFTYANGTPTPQEEGAFVHVALFYWEGAGSLPEDSNIGSNHIALIERIINSEEGLNTSNSHLNDVIEQRVDQNKQTASSVAPTQGGNLKNLFNTSEMRELHFLLHFQPNSDGTIDEYYLYTFERSILGSKQYVEVSPVYKTLVSLVDGQWKAMKSWAGKAETIYYDAKQGGGKLITIAPGTWYEANVTLTNPQQQ